MSSASKILLSSAAFSALFFTACGASDLSQDAAESAVQEPAEIMISADPAAAMETIAKELATGNGGILWKAMPASYQSDVNSIAQLAGTKVDSEIYNKSFALVGRIAEVADKQKTFILNTELGGAQPAEEIAKIEAAWPSIMGFVKSIANSSIATSAGLQAFDGQSFCYTTVSELIKYSEGMSAISGEELPISAYSGVSVKALESTDTTATLEMTGPEGDVETEDFVKVEERWVPAEMAADWPTSIADAQAQLEAMDSEQMAQSKPQILGVITMLEGVLTQIEAAESQEQFDQALQGAMMPIMGLMMMQGGGMGAPSVPAMQMPQ
ncbi:hypothetical protein OAA45_00705 [bacterium]|nr:hypothetical protein [bacterium]